jgi:hypothetical protein
LSGTSSLPYEKLGFDIVFYSNLPPHWAGFFAREENKKERIMEQEEFWVLCISTKPTEPTPIVKIVNSADIPEKDERLTILEYLDSKEHGEWVQQHCGDEYIIRSWRDRIHVDYSEMHPRW